IVDAISLLPWLVFLGQDLGLSLFNDGTVRLVVGHSLFSVAVVSYIVRARLVGLPANLEEASADLYAPPLRTFRKITLPLAMPAVLAGLLLSFTFSLDNTIVSSFVQVSGATPWPVYVLSALRGGLRPEIAAVSTIMLLLTLAALAVVALVLRRAGDSSTEIARTIAGGRGTVSVVLRRTSVTHADLAFLGGPVFTATTVRSRTHAVAVRDGR